MLNLHICSEKGCGKRFERIEECLEHTACIAHCPTCGQSSDLELTPDNIFQECEWCDMERALNDHFGGSENPS